MKNKTTNIGVLCMRWTRLHYFRRFRATERKWICAVIVKINLRENGTTGWRVLSA
jgi:hypothetical protein